MKKAKLFMMLALLVMGVSNVFAQHVTIGPNNGSLITGQAGGNLDDSGIKRGMASMWRHEQLALTMTTSDIANLTAAGELADPSCAIDVYNGNLIIGAGQTQTFVVVSLPKGYRITGYKLVLQPNVYGNGIQLHSGKNSWDIGNDDRMSFYETPAWSSGTPYGDNTHSTQLTCPDAIATATASDGSTVMQNDNATNRAKEFVIERTSQTETDMTNQLHFFFARERSQYAVTIKSFDIYFTAEGTFNADVVPSFSGEATDYVTSPFTTSKMDVGAIKVLSNLYTYDYTGVQDLTAFTHLYQDNAVAGGVPSHVDGEKNIYPVEVDGKGVYAFGNDTYFVEPPTTIHTASGWESPIGFRVVGAKFDYQWGTPTTGGNVTIPNACYIRGSYATDRGGSATGGYLDDQVNFTRTQVAWQIDEYGNIYREYTDASKQTYRKYLACFGSGDERVLSLSSAATGTEATWNLRIEEGNGNNRRVYYKSDSGNYYYLNWRIIQEGSTYHSRGYVTKNQTQNLSNGTTSGSHTVTIPSFTPGAYTLKIYGTDKDKVEKTITVNSAADADTYELTGLNNDAVKFEITGLEEGKQALVTITLELQALNPYIDKMDIVCHDPNDQFTLTQSFTADDFKVAGGAFKFYIPTNKQDDLLTLTFSNLYSKYGDETYYDGGDGNGRYSYVTSQYFVNNPDLYATSYDSDALYTNKVVTSTAGDIRFKFNNAEDMTTGTGDKFLQEYAFDYKTYKNGGYTDPDGTSSTSAFINCQLMAEPTAGYQKSGTYYVFTADETRYNIAPTTAWQHRFYAFYRMDIELVAADFTPSIEPIEVYENTFYESTSAPKRLAQYGVKLATNEKIPIDDPTSTDPLHKKEVYGYLSAKQVVDAITGLKTSNNIEKEQVLYVDASDLLSVIELKEADESAATTISQIKEGLGKNVLIYLPEKTTSTLDNFAYMTGIVSGQKTFRAGKDIVITDKYPFFAPYDVQVDGADYAIYKREITNDQNGKVVNATVMLPFTIDVTNGVHENKYVASEITSTFDPRCKFTMYQMNSTNALAHDDSSDNNKIDYGTGYFSPIKGTASVANTPYVVAVDAAYTDAQSSYLVRCGGSLVKATPKEKNGIFTGESAKGTLNEVTYDFTNTATYTGKEIGDETNGGAADAEEKVFYFAHDYFLDSKALRAPKSTKILPFRAFYAYTESGAGAKMSRFRIAFGENPNMGDTNGITDVQRDADLAVIPGKNTITLMARADKDVTIHAVSGITVDKCSLNAGETRVVNVPAGVYIINGVKMVVK